MKQFIFFAKSATSYELQIGRLCIWFCFLIGRKWKWYSFFKRIEIQITDKEGNLPEDKNET